MTKASDESREPKLASNSEGGLAFVTKRPVAITMLMVAIAVFGLVSLKKLSVDLLPEISYPTLTVRTNWPGAAPEDVEDRISMRIQEALNSLPKLVRTMSISRAGASDVVLEFDWGHDMTFAVQDVRDRLDGVFLPNGAERPLILRYDPNLDPILRIGLTLQDTSSSESDLIQLRWIAENRIERELESIKGVAAVEVRGGLEEEITISVDPYKLAAQSIDPTELANRLAQENINASAGRIREGSTDYLVRTLNEFREVEDIAELAVVRRGEGVIRVRDIASVVRTHAEREVITRINGKEAVEIALYREAGASIVELADRLRQRVFGDESQQAFAETLEQENRKAESIDERAVTNFLAYQLRDDADLEILSDQSTFIRAAIDDVKSAAIIGALLAVIVMWFFLRRISATFIVGLAIPISVVVTFAPMYLMEVSLNIMSLGGLALGVGMLVDNAIVVLESITRCREEGDSLDRAAVRGVREVSGAIIASTLTTVAVFAPIVFVHGIAGQIFGDQAVTVVSSLIVSLIVAILFIPMLASRRWLSPDGGGGLRGMRLPRVGGVPAWSWYTLLPNLMTILGQSFLFLLGVLLMIVFGVFVALFAVMGIVFMPFRFVFDRCWNGLARVYPGVLRAALAHSWVVVLLCLGLFYAAARRVPELGLELLPEIHQGEFTMRVGLGVGSPLEHTDRVMRRIDRDVRAIEGVAVTALTVGVEKETLTREIEGEHTARLTVRLDADHSSAKAEDKILAQLRSSLLTHPEVRDLDITRPTPFALEAPVSVEIRGHELEELEDVAAEVLARLDGLPQLTDVRSSVRPGHPEARVTFDRDKTLEYGLDLAQVSKLVRDQVLGDVATRFVEGEERIDVRVLGDREILSDLDAVLNLVVNPSSTTPVPLKAVADVDIIRGPAEIRRIGNSRATVVTAERAGLDLGGVSASVENALASLRTPDEVYVELGGQKREMDEASKSMKFALLLAIFLVYVVMASQFESLLQPLIILVSVPLAGVGVVFVLDSLGMPLSVVVFIGLILLAGIVVNNAIVLVDRINAKRAEGMSANDAILEAGTARLRPILMTTATTVLGLLPLTGWLASLPVFGAFGSGEGAEIRAPMAVTVIAGLVMSTALTLIVVPVIYSLMARLTGERKAPDTSAMPGPEVA